MTSAVAEAANIVQRLECGERGSCPCHTAARKGFGMTHAVWRGDHQPSLHVSVADDHVLVCDLGRRDQEDTLTELTKLGLWHGASGRPSVRVARMPAGVKDVADLLRQGRDAEYERMIAEAAPAVAWMVEHPPERNSRQFGLLGETLARLDEVSREAYVRRMAECLGDSVEVVREMLADYLELRRTGCPIRVDVLDD